MKGHFVLAALVAVTAIVTAGCGGGIARFHSTPQDYRVSGLTSHPEAMVREASDAHVRERQAETYDWAVRHGMAYPYYGGYAGTDMGYFYGGQYPIYPGVSPRDGYMTGGARPATREEVEMVRERADDAHERATDALRRQRGHQQWHREHR
jgi:hypothetical protein